MALSQTSSSRTISNLMRQQPVNLASQDDMSVVGGATIERRTRINRPDDENTRCSVSNVRGQPKDFSQLTQPPTPLSTSNASRNKRLQQLPPVHPTLVTVPPPPPPGAAQVPSPAKMCRSTR